MKSFDPGFGSPKMENVSSYIMFLALLNFQLIRKSWYTKKKKGKKKKRIHQMFFPMLSNRIWMLSGLCCCIVVFTFCLFTCMPQVWVYLPARRMPVNAFHVFHTMLDTSFHLLQHNCIMLYSYFFSNQTSPFPRVSCRIISRALRHAGWQWCDVLLCLSWHSYWSPCSSYQR